MRGRLVIAVFGAAVLVGAASAGVVGKIATLRPGDTAVFEGRAGSWYCNYSSTGVSCGVGDQTPTVDLVATSRSRALTVKVTASVPYTHVTKTRRRVCAEPGRCFYQDIYSFRGGAGG